ncbi:MAG: hypothetical protein IJR58_01250 [Lachnospiraceae bacterium]|nr:hypothetical protein [Lachnospiraceae bacterium]
MQIAAGNTEDTVFVCLSGSGYEWMITEALPLVEEDFTTGDKIIVAMGINDAMRPSFMPQYAKTINELALNHPDCQVFYVSLNPVLDKPESTVSNKQIDNWNAYMTENLCDDVLFINTHDAVTFLYHDWLHYETSCNRDVYEYIRDFVNMPLEQEEEESKAPDDPRLRHLAKPEEVEAFLAYYESSHKSKGSGGTNAIGRIRQVLQNKLEQVR